MHWLNYHHLLYFWTVAREGSIAKACDRLLLSQPTISGQIRQLEKSFGMKLFERVGRNLVLTDAGRDVYRYADEIFTIGKELQESVQGRTTSKATRLVVGIHDAMPKLICYKILAAALELDEPVQIVCIEGAPEQLLAKMALHELDVILTDSPTPPSSKVRAYNHLLGECDVALCGAPALVEPLRENFPRSLDEAPFLLPLSDTSMRRSLERWFDEADIRPVIRGEFADSALMKVFGREGVGLFAIPSAIEEDVHSQLGVETLAVLPNVKERFYLISVERKLRQPSVAAVAEMARTRLGADGLSQLAE
ncbi:MAG: transcriptional activator NhaR [Planctomycetales bacterium]|nr:transcriptional activator NhaR [Planctomycetales bacterium]